MAPQRKTQPISPADKPAVKKEIVELIESAKITAQAIIDTPIASIEYDKNLVAFLKQLSTILFAIIFVERDINPVLNPLP